MEIFRINQNNTYKVTFNLVDEDGTAVPGTSLDTMTLTLYYYNPSETTKDKYHLDIINSRNDQLVLNANDVTVDANGLVTWYMQPEDNTKMNSSTEEEIHVALFVWTWDTAEKKNSLELYFKVRKVPFM